MKKVYFGIIFINIFILNSCSQTTKTKKETFDIKSKTITSDCKEKEIYNDTIKKKVYKFLGVNAMDNDYEIILKLNEKQQFFFSERDDQECYETLIVSSGIWEQKDKNIILKVSEKLKPKITVKNTFLKKDTLTIFFNNIDCKLLQKIVDVACDDYEDEYTFFRDIHFYDRDNKEISMQLQNRGKIEIPTNRKIEKIDFYFPDDRSPNSTKISVKISEETGLIEIDNLSRYVQANFKNYSFVLDKEYILMNGFRIKNLKLEQVK